MIGRKFYSVVLTFLSLVVSACGSETAITQILVTVQTDLEMPSQIDGVEVVIGGKGQGMATANLREKKLPLTVPLVHDGGPVGPILITARGLLEGREIVRQTAQVSFERGATIKLTLWLKDVCVKVPCASGTTCSDGTCEGVDTFVPGKGFVEDGATGGDGGMSSGETTGGTTGATTGGSTSGTTGGTTGGNTGATTGGTTGGTTGAMALPGTCVISLPVTGDAYQQNTNIPLSGSCADNDGVALTSGLTWRSQAGVLGTDIPRIRLTSPQPSTPYMISLCPSESSLSGCSAAVSIDVTVGIQPTALITSPQTAESHTATDNTVINLVGTGSGAGVGFSWRDNLGVLSAEGATAMFTANQIGRHTIRLTATDRNGVVSLPAYQFITVLPENQTTLARSHSSANATLTDPVGIVFDRRNDSAAKGYVWSSDGKVYSINTMSPGADLTLILSQVPGQLSGVVRAIAFDEESPGRAYLATSAGLTVCPYSLSSGINNNGCNTLTTSTSGANNLPSDNVLSVAKLLSASNRRYILVGTDQGMLIIDPTSQGPVLGGKKASDVDGVRIRDIAADNDYHRAWLATDEGLFRFTPPTMQDDDGAAAKMTSDGQPGSDMTSVAVSDDSEHTVWVGAVSSQGSGGGLGHYRPDPGSWTRYRSTGATTDLASNNVHAVFIQRLSLDSVPGGARDVIWVGTDSGVSRLDETTGAGFMNLTMADGLPANKTVDVCVVPGTDRTKLFATTGGLALYGGL